MNMIRMVLLWTLLFASGCQRNNTPATVPGPPSAVTQDEDSLEAYLERKLRTASLLAISDVSGSSAGEGKDSENPLTCTWTFGEDRFVIKSDVDALPVFVTDMVLGRPADTRNIEGKWRVAINDGESTLILEQVSSGDDESYPDVTLELFHISPEVIYVLGDSAAEVKFQVDPEAGDR